MNTFQSQMSGSTFHLEEGIADQSGIRFKAFADTFLRA
jgi:hypothetical protein